MLNKCLDFRNGLGDAADGRRCGAGRPVNKLCLPYQTGAADIGSKRTQGEQVVCPTPHADWHEVAVDESIAGKVC